MEDRRAGIAGPARADDVGAFALQVTRLADQDLQRALAVAARGRADRRGARRGEHDRVAAGDREQLDQSRAQRLRPGVAAGDRRRDLGEDGVQALLSACPQEQPGHLDGDRDPWREAPQLGDVGELESGRLVGHVEDADRPIADHQRDGEQPLDPEGLGVLPQHGGVVLGVVGQVGEAEGEDAGRVAARVLERHLVGGGGGLADAEGPADQLQHAGLLVPGHQPAADGPEDRGEGGVDARDQLGEVGDRGEEPVERVGGARRGRRP